MTVDGTHCAIEEPRDKLLSKNKAFYSFKLNKAGLNYELGLSIFTNQLIWINGPIPAGTNDIKVYREHGLQQKIPFGKKIIGDNGYRGEKGTIDTPNKFDCDEVKEFKRRARSRHESINRRIKVFNCLNYRFIHSIKLHQAAFEAVCVIIQYQIENNNPLFDV
jgi:DDE superfamily endonuclease